MVEEDDSRRAAKRPWITVLVVSGIVAYVCVIRPFAAAMWVGALFGLSIALDFFVLRKQIQDSRIAADLAFCEIGKLFFLIAYIGFDKGWLTGPLSAAVLAGLSLAAALVITLAMLFAAAQMIRNAAVHGVSDQRGSISELLQDKVLALTAVVVAFLHVTYCLTFALAFEDRFGYRDDLYATSVCIDREPDPPTNMADPQHCPITTADIDRIRRFFFLESAATLPCTRELRDAARKDPKLETALCDDGIESRIDAFAGVAAPSCDQIAASALQRRAAVWNLSELYSLRSLFRKIAQKDDRRSYLIEIRGHANDTGLRRDPVLAYGSNYEISKQRADQVAVLIGEELQEAMGNGSAPAMRWLTYGVSNEPSFIGADVPADARPLDPKLSVELQIQKVGDSFGDRHLRAAQSDRRPLELLDYLYFTVYTITTTGYGDITPISAYAKAVVTLANLIELLFVVVLVNVIANTRPRSKGDEDALSPV
jgi:hypothetical protein